MLAVQDTGLGMDARTRARIFEPFFTTKEKGKGTGLGLSTVFGIVEQSGGQIRVKTEPARGTTFEIHLPRVGEDPHAVRAGPTSVAAEGSETILLVEDEDQVRRVVAAILERQGYRVLVAPSAESAIEIADAHSGRIDLLLTDVVLPQMSGPELAKHLGAARPGLKVLCMSGYTDDSVVRHGLAEGTLAFLQKPLTQASLVRKVRELLNGDG